MPAPSAPRTSKAIFLDRDGVLNRTFVRDGKPCAPRRLADFRLLPRAAECVRRLKDDGYLVFVFTNQPDIGNGLVDQKTVEAMNRRLQQRTGVDDIFMCVHAQTAGCRCRKPKPGMLRKAAARYSIDLKRSCVVGDRWSDVLAGERAGCRTIFIDRGYREPRPATADAVVRSLAAAVEAIRERDSNKRV